MKLAVVVIGLVAIFASGADAETRQFGGFNLFGQWPSSFGQFQWPNPPPAKPQPPPISPPIRPSSIMIEQLLSLNPLLAPYLPQPPPPKPTNKPADATTAAATSDATTAAADSATTSAPDAETSTVPARRFFSHWAKPTQKPMNMEDVQALIEQFQQLWAQQSSSSTGSPAAATTELPAGRWAPQGNWGNYMPAFGGKPNNQPPPPQFPPMQFPQQFLPPQFGQQFPPQFGQQSQPQIPQQMIEIFQQIWSQMQGGAATQSTESPATTAPTTVTAAPQQ